MTQDNNNADFTSGCEHAEELLAACQKLVSAIFDIEAGDHSKATAEEKLGYLSQMACMVIYDASKVLEIDTYQMQLPDGRVVSVKPAFEPLPPKGSVN